MRQIWPIERTLGDDDLVDLYASGRAGTCLRANFVTSVDGAVAVDGSSRGLSGPADRALLGLLRMFCDALLVGAGTLRREDYRPVRLSEPRRTWRRAHGLAEYPTLVVVSNKLDLDPRQRALADAPVRPTILTTATAAAGRADLAAVADLLPCGDREVDLVAGLAALHARGLAQVLTEGGPHLFGALTGAGLLDELCLTVSPLVVGPRAGRITAGAQSARRYLTLRHVVEADGALFLRYARAQPHR